MFKRLLLLSLAALICFTASAQFRYTFKDTTTPYTPLTGAASMNGGVIWDEDIFTTPMPFIWQMDGTIAVDTFLLETGFPSLLADTSNPTNLNGFIIGDMDLADRGLLAGTGSRSPIRYVTTGSAPNRIFKVEVANAGFYEEQDLYNTMDDSISFQIWIYETKNIVEIHFGPSSISNPSDYYGYNFGGSGPLIGFGKNIDFASFSGKIYNLKGNPASPAIDTFSFPSILGPTTLSAWPANGKVYRFTPLSAVPCVKPTPNYTAGAPSGKTVQYTYTGTTSPLDSLVWDFGDAVKQKITTGFTTPVSHTFANNGRYNVCVTAYNTCGSNVSCKQLALAVGDFSALGNIKVYPNPSSDFITIEGMKSAGTYTVQSAIGQAALSGTIIGGSKQMIDISALPAGVYMLLLTNNEGARGIAQIIKR